MIYYILFLFYANYDLRSSKCTCTCMYTCTHVNCNKSVIYILYVHVCMCMHMHTVTKIYLFLPRSYLQKLHYEPHSSQHQHNNTCHSSPVVVTTIHSNICPFIFKGISLVYFTIRSDCVNESKCR